MFSPINLESIPAELLYEVQLFALSSSLPYLSRYFFDVYNHSSPVLRAKYIVARSWNYLAENDVSDVYSKALRYPICTQEVFESIYGLLKDVTYPEHARIQLPRRLFRSLVAPDDSGWTETHWPLPFLRFLYYHPGIPRFNSDADEGYALTKAVHARFLLLVQFLLNQKASPKCRAALAVKVAIRQKNLAMVKLLIERTQGRRRDGKRRKMLDRVQSDSSMLKIAVQSDARDIVEYLYREKGLVPDLDTLQRMAF